MADDSLEKYILAAQKNGFDNSTIEKRLLSAGWSQSEISTHLTESNLPEPPRPSSQSHHNGSLWDTFVHILMFISLLFSTVSFIIMNLILVDIWLPKYSYSYYSGVTELIQIPLSALIVSAPFFIFLFIHTNKQTQKRPELKQLRARKILIYLTLTITFITMLISLITLVSNFISGEVSSRFLLKFAIVTLTTGGIFAYYLSEVKES